MNWRKVVLGSPLVRFVQCLATPTNRSDPNLVQWTKYAGNPVISVKAGAMPGRDPTTGWWSPAHNAWLMAYGTTEGADVYQSADFFKWSSVGFLNSVRVPPRWVFRLNRTGCCDRSVYSWIVLPGRHHWPVGMP